MRNKWMPIVILILGVVLAAYFIACGEKGDPGAQGIRGLNALVTISDEPAGDNCDYGGIKVATGLDGNRNGVLDPDEITETHYVCSIEGPAGFIALVSISDEPLGDNCDYGGIKIETGLDANQNGVLDPAEVSETQYVCNGDGGSPEGEYWFVNHNIIESSIEYTMDEIFNSTIIMSIWGTMSLNSTTSQWTIYPGDIYNSASAPFGMAKHGHRLTSWDEAWGMEGYYNPSEPDPAGQPYIGTYTLEGNRLFLVTPDGGIINGAFSLDYQSFVGTSMEGMITEFLYAFKKPTTAPAFKPDGKYMVVAPSLEIKYAAVHPNTGVLNGTEIFYISHDFTVIDNAADKIVEWATYLPFGPVYAPITNALEGWSSDGPKERASIDTFDLGSLSIRADGLVEIPDRFTAMGKGGSSLFAGSTLEEEDIGFHIVKTGSILELETSPTLSDIAGTWLFSMIEGKAMEGIDPGWSDGDEQLLFSYSLMDIIIDSGGNAIANKLAFKWVFSGTVDTTPKVFDIKVRLVDECYNPGTSIYAADCTDGITIPVFIINGVDSGGNYLPEPSAKFVLDSSHNLASLWEPFDEGGVPCDEQTGPCLGDAKPRFQFGLGVKYK